MENQLSFQLTVSFNDVIIQFQRCHYWQGLHMWIICTNLHTAYSFIKIWSRNDIEHSSCDSYGIEEILYSKV